ncbi:MAG: hypothetical protein WBB45_19230 [Cyclobacteriaceae bacterium]
MNWQEIKVSGDNTHFLHEGKPVFGRRFIDVLKFHSPGLAPVQDASGSYHIDSAGTPLYSERYTRTFGFYGNRAAVVQAGSCFHITEKGLRAYRQSYAWTGNFQEDRCPVRNADTYFHIDPQGSRVYPDTYLYCGDFKDGIACVKTSGGSFRHIHPDGAFLHSKEFSDLGIYHKNFATARDRDGWHHIDKSGNAVYNERYLAVEPFYNGFALATRFDNKKVILSEQGEIIIAIG